MNRYDPDPEARLDAVVEDISILYTRVRELQDALIGAALLMCIMFIVFAVKVF